MLRAIAASLALALWLAPPAAARSVALVIGNANYEAAPHPTAAADSAAVEARLLALGFDEVWRRTDLNTADYKAVLADFARIADGGDTVVIYYSGYHYTEESAGFAVDYVAPVDASAAGFAERTVEPPLLGGPLARIAARAERLGVVIFDIGRRPADWEAGRNLKDLVVPRPGVLVVRIAPANEPGAPSGPLSPFAQSFAASSDAEAARDVRLFLGGLSRFATPGAVFEYDVEFGPLPEDAALVAGADGSGAPPTDVGDGVFRDALSSGGEGPRMVALPGGSFDMGGAAYDSRRAKSETPRRTVEIEAFAMGEAEITVAEFRRFLEASGWPEPKRCNAFEGGAWRTTRSWRAPGFAQGDDHPSVCVSWSDASAYAAWLSEETGARYRLPSEAEWEYAARAGAQTIYFWGDDAKDACAFANIARPSIPGLAPLCRDGFRHTAPVRSFRPNAFGLYDMSGNALEFTADCYYRDYAGAPGRRDAATRRRHAGLRLHGGARRLLVLWRWRFSPVEKELVRARMADMELWFPRRAALSRL